jgi:hypothetical protein
VRNTTEASQVFRAADTVGQKKVRTSSSRGRRNAAKLAERRDGAPLAGDGGPSWCLLLRVRLPSSRT